ncbi:MAG: hypothetical protein IJL54_07985 [Prevotella sp.]|nr:hypothetical protein [Prevotella sp.]
MEKSYKLFLALLFCFCGAMSVNAEERYPLTTDMFFAWDGWGADAQKTGPAECSFVLNESTGQPYGDSQVINYADLSLYSKLIVTCTEGTPRFLFNRDIDEGQWNENEAESHLIDNTKNGWSARYFSQDGQTYVVDLKLMVKEKGFAHLHAIKGANWANVTVTSMELTREGKAQVVGWTDLITNGDLEGDDVSCFYSKEAAGSPFPSVITDGVGVDGSRGIQVHSAAGAAQDWDAQFWINLPETLPEGTKYRISFAYRASMDGSADTQAHRDPSDYVHYEMIGSPNFTTEWQVYNYEGTITAQQSGENTMHSIAFNLSKDRANDIDFFFDNIKFEVYKYGTVAEFSEDVIELDFGFETNVGELVKATGKRRLMYPTSCVRVLVNGEEKSITSVEGFADGRFYVFMDEGLNEDDVVELAFINPSDPAFHLTYLSGPGGDVPNFSGEVTNNYEIQFHPSDDVYPYQYLTPVIVEADPEDGSFNLPNSIKEFKVTFDKPVDCEAVEATLNNIKLEVSPADGFAEQLVLTRPGSEDLATDAYELRITKIYPELRLDDSIYGDSIYTINVGKVNADPTDVPADLLPDYFATANAGTIPEGWFVKFGQEDRPSLSSQGSGSRMFDFAAGGDFTKGLYFREGYAEYGSTEGYPLTLEAGKRYTFSFTTAMWKDNGTKTRFEIINPAGEVVFVQVVNNTPNVNGGTGAVNGAAKHSFKYSPEEAGNYIIRFTSSGDETSDPAYMEIILANPQVKYVPNVAGVEETQLLNNALANAKSTRDGNTGERYAGPAFNALDEAIKKYEAEAPNYTAPSAYKNAAAALDAATQAMKDHRSLCDAYDPLPQQAQDIIDANAGKKFANTSLYADLINLVDKYATKTTETVYDPDTETEKEVVILVIKQLTDDNELKAATDELKYAVNTASLLFTEGESKTSDTGYKVLLERIRLGVEALKSLGVDESDPLIIEANNTLTDDDEVADKIKNRIKVEMYGKLKDPANTVFAEKEDEMTGEMYSDTYDMTVFVKNPNIYKQQDNTNFTPENVPGWTVPEGYATPGLSVGWGQPRGTNEIAEDCMFQTWGSSYRVEQTITDLPAGVYTIKIGFGERMNEDEANMVDSYIYAKTSETPEGENGQTADVPGIGQSFPYANTVIENVVVTDGILTIGANGGPSSHTFFNDVRVLMAGAVPNFDYISAYNEAITSIDDAVARPASVRAIELFDLNGRRIQKAGKGVVIMRKHMSDGSVVTEKVVKR